MSETLYTIIGAILCFGIGLLWALRNHPFVGVPRVLPGLFVGVILLLGLIFHKTLFDPLKFLN